MANISALSPQLDKKALTCVCIVETPKNSRRKYKFDEASGLFKLAYELPEGMNFPFDFGFIPSTRAEDGDPIDILVLADEPGAVGCMIDIRLIGVINAQQTEDGKTERNDRLLAVPINSHSHRKLKTIDELDPSIITQIEHFFLSYTKLQDKKFKILGCSGPKHAVKLVTKAMDAFKQEDK